jgi:hypothetical protein
MKKTLMLASTAFVFILATSITGCDYTGLQQQAQYNVYSDWRSLFGKEKIEYRASAQHPHDSAYVSLYGNANLDKYLGPTDLSRASGKVSLGLSASYAAIEYQKKLGANFIVVSFYDSAGNYLTGQSFGAPDGYHVQQDGVAWDNGPFGPTNVHETYGIYPNQ